MMPIFFNAESHFWIAYLFFINGFLIHALLDRSIADYRGLTQLLEAKVLAAFFISIMVNGLLLLVADVASLPFLYLRTVLPILTLCLALAVLLGGTKSEYLFLGKVETKRLLAYAVVFIILFFNGGLIERIADSWWHISLANKIVVDNTIASEVGHLHALSSRYYPPLWHANLALANVVSGISIPVVWNSVTAWSGVLTVMSFYLFARALKAPNWVALLAAMLFILLPGIGNSYLRVSAWPSHIAYAAWFSLFYLTFSGVDCLAEKSAGSGKLLRVLKLRTHLACSALLVLLIYFTHKVELIWFLAAIVSYTLALSVGNLYFPERSKRVEDNQWAVRWLGSVAVTLLLVLSVYFFTQVYQRAAANPDLTIAFSFPIIVCCWLLLTVIHWSQSNLFLHNGLVIGLKVFGVIIACLLVASIDARQLLSLFDPELAYAIPRFAEKPIVATGFWGNSLELPGWHLQLRAGLLYSGIASIPIGLLLVYLAPSRLTIFTVSSSILSIFFCLSPYAYHWLSHILDYHSAWRITILVFHPIILASALHYCWCRWQKGLE